MSAPSGSLKKALLRLFGIRSKEEEEALLYMSRVEAAYIRKPRIGPVFLSLGALGLTGIFLLWAAYAELDEVTHGQGQVVSAQRTQIIQNLEGGILREILAREGDVVEKNQPLARLDNMTAESQYQEATNKALEHEVALVRLTAEKNGTVPVFTQDLLIKAPQIVADQMALYTSRHERLKSELEQLDAQHEQRMRDVEEQKSRKKQMEESLALAEERRNIAQTLLNKKLFSRVEYLDLQQKVVALQGEITALASNIPKAEEAAREADEKLQFRKAEAEADISEEINKRRTELSSLQAMVSAGGDRVTRTELRSPVRGTVKQIIINTLGGVVRPGDPIMEVVPLDDTLLVEARIRPADIAFVHPQQKAMVKLSAYDFSIYGGLEGKVEQISADTIEDKRGELYYLVKVRTDKNSIAYRDSQLPIIPGMVATVDIVSGKKSILDYLLKPILKARQNALRER